MKALRIVGIIIFVLILLLCAVLFVLRFRATEEMDRAALEAASATPVPTAVPVTPQPTETPAPTEAPTPTPEPTPAVDPDSPEGRALALGLPKPPEIDIESWEFILANGENSIDEYTPPEIQYLESQPLDSRIIEPMQAMASDARAQGLSVYLSSGYRSYSEQAANFIRVCQNNGVSDGKNADGFYITMPAGCSEHQTGLACDITDIYYPLKDKSIANTATYKYMSQHCQEFGFIVRFPEDKEAVTGVMFEPFHYRYVGIEAAKYIMENGICLEEFVSLYRDINPVEK